MGRIILGLVAALVVVGLAIQLVPYGRDHTNPPVVMEPSWDSPQTRELAVRACFDCHSNQTVWPWYSNIAPISWLVQQDVDSGRSKLNFSRWDNPGKEARESAETVQKGEMPPSYYVVIHPEANLSSDEKAALARGLAATVGGRTGEKREGGERRESD